jgi:hypothetical protein
VFELPFARTTQSAFGETESSSAIGNPYVGLLFDRGATKYEFGARAPLAPDDEAAVFYGLYSDQNRIEAFIPDFASVRASATHTAGAGAVQFVFAGGPSVWIPTGDSDGGDTELLLDYSGMLVTNQQALRLAGGITGRGVVTEEGSISERTQHQAIASASYAFGRFRPGIHARLPLDGEMRSVMNGTFGISLQMELGR